jgi:hypothetical protein
LKFYSPTAAAAATHIRSSSSFGADKAAERSQTRRISLLSEDIKRVYKQLSVFCTPDKIPGRFEAQFGVSVCDWRRMSRAQIEGQKPF